MRTTTPLLTFILLRIKRRRKTKNGFNYRFEDTQLEISSPQKFEKDDVVKLEEGKLTKIDIGEL